MSNRLYKTITVTMIAMAMLGFSLISNSLWTNRADADEVKNTITVNGEGIVKVKPNMAYASMGVDTISKEAKDAQKNNSAAMNKVIQVLKSMGIAEDDIKTTDYSIYPEQNYDEKTKQTVITGYHVSNTVEVTVRDINSVGSVIDKAGDAGANRMYNISFTVSDDSAYYQQALQAAAKNAKGKADAIAKSLGVSIVGPVSVTEQSAGGPIVYGSINSMKEMAADGAGTSVSTGELEVKAQISIAYGYSK